MDQEQLINEVKKVPKLGGIGREVTTKEFIEMEDFPKETLLIKDFFPLVSEAFPSKFNLSVAEYPWSQMCKKRGFVINKKIFEYTKLPKHSFWTITRNIRDDDFNKILSGSNQHLLLFHIMGVNGFSITELSYENRRFYVEEFIRFLSNYIDVSKLNITYFPGGEVKRHGIIKVFPPDINLEIYKELSERYGFKMMETDEDTFLSLQVFGSAIFWGYRNEYLLEYKGKLLDIGTIETLPYTPIYRYKDGRIKYLDIKRTEEKGFIGSAIGLERFMMVLEGAGNIWDTSIIKPLIDFLRGKARNNLSDIEFFMISEILKVLIYVVLEKGDLTRGALENKHRKEIISNYSNVLVGLVERAGIDVSKELIDEFFSRHISLNPVDKDLLGFYSDEKINNLLRMVSEQIRMYRVSPKYKAKVDLLIKDFPPK